MPMTGNSHDIAPRRSATVEGLRTAANVLARTIEAAWERPFYRRHWRAEAGVERLDDALELVRAKRLDALPVVRKHHLRDNFTELTDMAGATEIFSSSGTTGRPIDMPITRDEEADQVRRVRRLMRELGVRSGSRVLQLLSLNDLFSAGPLSWQAAKAEGGCAIRCTIQRPARLRLALEHLAPRFVVGNPIALVRLAEGAADWWPEPSALPDHAFLVGAATFDAELRPTALTRRVAELWGFRSWLSSYGASDVGPVAFECRHHTGMHVHDDTQHVELVDPRTGALVTEPETPGEIVVTGLTLPRGFIPVRYGTGDMAAWLRTDPCPSRPARRPRLGPIIGRIGRHLKLVGQTVFPEFLMDLADDCDGVARSAVEVHRGPLGDDDVTLLVLTDPGEDWARLDQRVRTRLAQNLPTTPAVRLTTPEELARLEARQSRGTNMVKPPRFFDLRGPCPS